MEKTGKVVTYTVPDLSRVGMNPRRLPYTEKELPRQFMLIVTRDAEEASDFFTVEVWGPENSRGKRVRAFSQRVRGTGLVRAAGAIANRYRVPILNVQLRGCGLEDDDAT